MDLTTQPAADASHPSPETSRVEILAPTFLEYWAARRVLPNACISWTGARLARWKGARQDSIVIVCGLAGALTSALRPGAILIPEQVGTPDGRITPCDPALVQALLKAARELNFQPASGPLLTGQSLIVGEARHKWFQQGFVGADMETGLLVARNLRVATVRVVLDSPEYGISPDWMRPASALLQPRLWPELLWLSRAAPGYALRAARVLKVALEAGSWAISAD